MRLWGKCKSVVSPIQTFVDGIPVAASISTYDAHNQIILASNSLHEKLTGWKNCDIVGKSLNSFDGLAISEDIKRDMQEDHFTNVDITNSKSNGTPYRINLTVMGVVIDGQNYYVAIKTLA